MTDEQVAELAADAMLVMDCLAWIRAYNGVTFGELDRWLAERGVETEGDYRIEPLPNTILWAGISERYCEIFEQLRPALKLQPMGEMETLMVHLSGGNYWLKLPIAKRPTRVGYTKPHWLPVYLKPSQP